MKFSPAQMNKLRAQFGSVKTCSVGHFLKLKALIVGLDPEKLAQLADSGIQFVDTAANSVMVDRGLRGRDARIDHAVDKIMKRATASAAA